VPALPAASSGILTRGCRSGAGPFVIGLPDSAEQEWGDRGRTVRHVDDRQFVPDGLPGAD